MVASAKSFAGNGALKAHQLWTKVWQGIYNFIGFKALRFSLPGPFSVFGAVKTLASAKPTHSLVAVLIVAVFLLNVLASERLAVRGLFPGLSRGPEASAADTLFETTPQDILLDQAAFAFPGEGIPDTFSGYFFVFEDSVAGWANPASEALDRAPGRNQVIIYEVQEGDSPASIASRFGISADTVLWANNLERGSVIKPGQQLVILPVSGVLHEVAAGDTLSAIGRKYGISEQRISAVNNFAPEDTLTPGEKIVVPGAKPPGYQAFEPRPSQTASNMTAQATAGFFRAPTTGWNWGRLHRNNAVDIANACGTPVFAAASGFVTDVQIGAWNGGYGNFIRIRHENGLESVYAHLAAIMVSVGAYVNQGDIIGSIGNTGKTHGPTGCHVHFEVRGGPNPFAKY